MPSKNLIKAVTLCWRNKANKAVMKIVLTRVVTLDHLHHSILRLNALALTVSPPS